MRFLKRAQPASRRRVTLKEAVEQRLAVFELWGVAEGVASKMRLKITKLTDEPLEIVIPRGTEFAPVMRPRQPVPSSTPDPRKGGT